MHEQLWFTSVLNHYFAGTTNAALGVFHVTALNPAAPIPNYVAMQILVCLILLAFMLSKNRPGQGPGASAMH